MEENTSILSKFWQQRPKPLTDEQWENLGKAASNIRNTAGISPVFDALDLVVDKVDSTIHDMVTSTKPAELYASLKTKFKR